jgi:hypothetical protein
MTASEPLSRPPLTANRTTEVVAGLVNDGSADIVARTAVAAAARLGTDVRFVHAITSRLGTDETTSPDEATFHAALGALRGHSRVRCTFEAVRGDPVEVLVERSKLAALLVVGEDHPGAATRVAEECRQRAECVVEVVSARS